MLKCRACNKQVNYIETLSRDGESIHVYWCSDCGRVWEHYGQDNRTKRVIH